MKYLILFLSLLYGCLWPALSIAQSLSLTWTDTADNEEGFQIDRKCEPEIDFVLLVTLPFPDTQSYEDTSVQYDVLCTYRVLAYNIHGESQWSNEASGIAHTTPPLLPPNAPTDLIVTTP
jgi:hypothetical protein